MSTPIHRAAPAADVDIVALAGSCGYRVDDPNGRVGTLHAILYGAWSDRPDAIEVRVGLFRQSFIVVDVDDVAGVDPVRRRVVLRRSVDFADAYLP